ncbi:MAG: hypothetical protein C5B52_01535 [Bacteroidetes bacterium]|nr:MAG: hypothetical protein C5B52_01535 [Bacteroidota bacterium]
MSIKKINPRTIVLFLFIVAVAALRLSTNFSKELGPLAVFTPLGAMALFSGAYFTGNLKPFAFPLLTLFISDLVLSFTVLSPYRIGLLYPGWFWTYSAFALMVVAGKLIINNVTLKNLVLGVIVVTLIHWLVSDIGGCLIDTRGVNKFSIYLERLVSAIPYELRFLGGTAIYSALMFGIFEWMKVRYASLKIA